MGKIITETNQITYQVNIVENLHVQTKNIAEISQLFSVEEDIDLGFQRCAILHPQRMVERAVVLATVMSAEVVI